MGGRIIANELIPVYESELDEKVVDARELHGFLEVGRDFSSWIKDRIQKYEFVEGEDFTLTLTKTGERQNVTRHDYTLKLDVAKEICMVESNEKGSEARKYFIEVEKRFKVQSIDTSKLTPEMQMLNLLFQAEAKTQLALADTQKKLSAVEETVEVIKDTFAQRDEDWRKQVNAMLQGASFRSGGNYSELRTESYRLLEERAHCDLDKRMRNLLKRLEDNGATKSKIREANKMDVIEADAQIKEIYASIVKELNIGSLQAARG